MSGNFPKRDNCIAGMPTSTSATLGFIKPEIPTLVPEPPSGEGWNHEIKHDGYRTLIIIDQGKVRALSRHGRGLDRTLAGWSRRPGSSAAGALRKLIAPDPRPPVRSSIEKTVEVFWSRTPFVYSPISYFSVRCVELSTRRLFVARQRICCLPRLGLRRRDRHAAEVRSPCCNSATQ